ncbi:MAG: GMC oxidoreductase [Hyphomicrobiaceae bacterium]
MDFDAIVIGSGFGGAVSACRLAEAGYRVLVLERGRRWAAKADPRKDATPYPREPNDPWWWSQLAPERWNGWLDLRVFRTMAVAQGAAVGGGSLIYANISAVPDKSIFETGWPPEITWNALAPHYATVGKIMAVRPIPKTQWPKRMRMMRDAAQAIGAGARFKELDLAVSFDPEWTYDKPNAVHAASSRRFVNDHGVEQGYCVHLGECDIGCPADAKNTLDRNYLALAERKGADIRPLHLVSAIAPMPGGYSVAFDRLDNGRKVQGSASARVVVSAAGSLGSTELLLHCRDVWGTLPQIGDFLGRNWSSNGDFLTPAFYKDRKLKPWEGPTISSAIDFLDRSRSGQSFWIQDGGFPHLFANWLQTGRSPNPQVQAFLIFVAAAIRKHGPLKNVMPWFAQGIDAGNGTLRLRRRWTFFGQRDLTLDWKIADSRKAIDAIVAMHKELSKATEGVALVPPSWEVFHYLITPHPLGGCNMGTTPANGVVDHKGEVFGYRNLFVLDGAIVPEAVGVNPSRTIAALAERATALIVEEGR